MDPLPLKGVDAQQQTGTSEIRLSCGYTEHRLSEVGLMGSEIVGVGDPTQQECHLALATITNLAPFL